MNLDVSEPSRCTLQTPPTCEQSVAELETPNPCSLLRKRTIWIDLDNSPHVPFFAPIIEELQKRSYSIVLTARECFQVRELADLFHMNYKLIGRHYGRHKVRKLWGLGIRGLQLIPIVLKEKPDLAISHGSRSQLIVSNALRIPSLLIVDYECANRVAFTRPTWYMCPEVIPTSAFKFDPHRILRYPGIKEDVYVPRFVPDPHMRFQLGLRYEDLVVAMRPPATEAHYHRPESDQVFDAVIDFLSKKPEAKMVLLPRNERQGADLKTRWSHLFANQTMRMPKQIVDGLNLIWHSDLVISGGGTMNREAAALGVPVYSTFRGTIGAVDRYLCSVGRLVLLECAEDVKTKIRLVRRNPPPHAQSGNHMALRRIVDCVVGIVERKANVTTHSNCLNLL